MTPVRTRRIHSWIVLLAIAAALVGAAPARATAGAPTDQLRPAIDHVLRILDDRTLRGPQHAPRRRAALREVIDGVLDYPDAARRALGVHWQGRTAAEREQFVALFRDLVSYSYIAAFDGYAGDKVTFVGEVPDVDVVTVMTRIRNGKGVQTAVDYRMHQQGTRWYVYDVSVQGVSLVGNYRAQFNTIMRTASYDELVRRLRARVTELVGPVPSALPPPERAPRDCPRQGSVAAVAMPPLGCPPRPAPGRPWDYRPIADPPRPAYC